MVLELGRLVVAALTAVTMSGAGGCGGTATLAVRTPAAIGAYLGPATKGVAALPDWEAWAGVTSPFALDFQAAAAWKNIEGEDWQLNPWQASGRRLILAVPLLPDPAAGGPPTSLAECAAGLYDKHWRTLAHNLVRHNLTTTVLRPGWEFNGAWYPWAAAGHEAEFVTCFQRLVKAMRAEPGQRFQFVWNVTIGGGAFPAEQAFPGRDYIDAVGVDVYDVGWAPGSYPIPPDASDTDRAARVAKAWAGLYSGDHGLAFWSDFARRMGLRLALPEWGLTTRGDGHGGGDNPYYVDRMMDFIRDPANQVSFAMYFNSDPGSDNRHRVTGDGILVPVAAAELQRRLRGGV